VKPGKAPAIVQAGPLGLTADGVAASVRSVQTNVSTSKGRAKASVAALSFVALALVAWLGRGLLSGPSKSPVVAVAAAAAQPAPVVEHSALAAAPASPLAAAPASEPAPPAESQASSLKIVHASATRSRSAVTAHAPTLAKAAPAKSAADLLSKRH
jgi:hypothetical protein